MVSFTSAQARLCFCQSRVLATYQPLRPVLSQDRARENQRDGTPSPQQGCCALHTGKRSPSSSTSCHGGKHRRLAHSRHALMVIANVLFGNFANQTFGTSFSPPRRISVDLGYCGNSATVACDRDNRGNLWGLSVVTYLVYP